MVFQSGILGKEKGGFVSTTYQPNINLGLMHGWMVLAPMLNFLKNLQVLSFSTFFDLLAWGGSLARCFYADIRRNFRFVV